MHVVKSFLLTHSTEFQVCGQCNELDAQYGLQDKFASHSFVVQIINSA
jgi:hypothetical protein